MEQHIVIVSGGRFGDPDFFRESMRRTGASLFIACDGGARNLQAAGYQPSVIIGDLDSIEPSLLAEYEINNVKIIRHPASKDFSDTELALNYALNLKPAAVDIWGALGGRFDHALSNVHLLLRGRESGIFVRLLDEFCEIFIARAEEELKDAHGCLVSLLALSPLVEGIVLVGFQYPLHGESLSISQSRGLSNLVAESSASIRVQSGALLVVRYHRKDIFPEVC